MKPVCLIARRAAAAYANNEMGTGRWADFLRGHILSCPECAREAAEFRAAARALNGLPPAQSLPNVSWEVVRLRILERREARRRRAAALGVMRRGAVLAVTAGVAAVALWALQPLLYLEEQRSPGWKIAQRVEEPVAPPVVVAQKPTPPPHPAPRDEAWERHTSRPKTITAKVTPPRREGTLSAFAPPRNIVPAPTPAETIAVELSPNRETGTVEAAVVPADEGSLLIET